MRKSIIKNTQDLQQICINFEQAILRFDQKSFYYSYEFSRIKLVLLPLFHITETEKFPVILYDNLCRFWPPVTIFM